ncbi:hypothetical protein LMIY3S_03368 [Labrys miyagiensis]
MEGTSTLCTENELVKFSSFVFVGCFACLPVGASSLFGAERVSERTGQQGDIALTIPPGW